MSMNRGIELECPAPRVWNRSPWAPLGLLACVAILLAALVPLAFGWTEDDFAHRTLVAYPVPPGRDNIIGEILTYKIKKGDTLLDVGRYYDLSGKEVSDANGHMDWWLPPVGREIILPTQHILPVSQRRGVVMNIPEMRIYYYPTAVTIRGKGKHKTEVGSAAPAQVVYTFPVGLGRFDWKTPVGPFSVRGKTKDPTWVVPDDIYQEHLERDGEAEHMIPGGDPDNPLGKYRIELSLPEYGIHGTNVPWGVGMTVSHGCIRLYPEDIDVLFHMVHVGMPGQFVYEPIKFGWRANRLYVEVHDDIYGMYPGLWNHATKVVEQEGLQDQVDMNALQKAVIDKTGVPTYVGHNEEASSWSS
jgi:L,D-transpeptidase ErfK/SrfK